jgi:hypothetical protein
MVKEVSVKDEVLSLSAVSQAMSKLITSNAALQALSAVPRTMKNGGEGGIRTLEGLASLTVFETAAFNRSATSPLLGYKEFFLCRGKQKSNPCLVVRSAGQ